MSQGNPSLREKPLPFQYSLFAGAVAGVSEILCMYPLDGIHP
jgi:hypothetical protein